VAFLGVLPLSFLVPDIRSTVRRFGVQTRHARARAALMALGFVRVVLADVATPETPRAAPSVRGPVCHCHRLASHQLRRKPNR
jgi:hypothetical protein